MPLSRSVEASKDEKLRRLAVLLAEAESRGIELDLPGLQKNIVFPTDSEGYFTKLSGKRYIPTDEQRGFIQSDAVFSAFIGGRGSGKSGAGSQKALKKISQGLSGAVFNPKFEDFKTSTWLEFREWIPWDMVVPSQRYRGEIHWEPSQPFTLTFMNGAKVLCKGLKDPDSARGPNINWLWYDEAGSDPDGLSWQIALASVRVGENIQAWISTTPKGKHHWIYKFFVDQDIPEEALKEFEKTAVGRELIEMFHGSIYANKDNLNPIFYANMLTAYPSGWLRQQEVDGKFVEEGGNLGDRTWFRGKILPVPPETVSGRVRYWDLAATEKKTVGSEKNDPDETVGTKMSWIESGKINPQGVKEIGTFYIENQRSGFLKYEQILDLIVEVAELDGPYIPIYLEEEPGSGGKNQVAAISKHIKEKLGSHYRIYGHNPRTIGDKVMRANVWFAEAANGQFYMVQGNWNEPALEQLDEFPSGKKDDKIDSISGARHTIAPIISFKDIEFLHL